MPQIETLGTLRHECHATGGCCQGNIAILKPIEQETMRAQAVELNIPSPIENNAIRKESGRCVFLEADQKCTIHSRYGHENKPTICQQFPLVAIHTEKEIRIGIDPSCLSAWKTWKDGPLINPGSLISTKKPVQDIVRNQEQTLLDLLDTSNNVQHILTRLTGSSEQFLIRWFDHLAKIPFDTIFVQDGTAPIFHQYLSQLSGITSNALHHFTLSATQQEWVIESTQRMLYLRFLNQNLTPPAIALLCLGGAVALATQETDNENFHKAYATWNKAIRSPVFLAILLPTPQTLSWLAGVQS